MRQILVTVMLILVVIAIYNGTIGGAGGTHDSVKAAGSKINVTIQSINP